MIVTYNWLKQFVDIEVSAEKLADDLTNIGFEVEEIIYQNKNLHHVVCGQILDIKKHENADKLVVCSVDIGKITQIVTGATNIKVGDKVPVSLEGASLANGIDISNSKIRGVDSFGMFCSVEELGVTDYDGILDGIMILDENAEIGAKIEDVLMMNDIILDINVTANRPDAMSIIGIAREVSAIYNKPVKYEVEKFDVCSENTADFAKVDVENFELCKRYMASYIKDVKIEKSPLWLRARLVAVGIKPINNIVDITNYVLTEVGQPMHAFDYKNLENGHIVVRQAKQGESLDCLNNASYDLNESILCVCDSQKPVVIAGIIGGLNSCVNNDTTSILFESACFERSNIRRTARKIGVRTDSAARYEKGVDASLAEIGLNKALYLINKLNAGTICKGIIDVNNGLKKPAVLNISISRISKLLGIEVEKQKLLDVLNNLNIKSEAKDDTLICEVPVYRSDIENYADIAEEYIRMIGYNVYDNVEAKLLENTKVTFGKSNTVLKTARELKYQLCDSGFMETVNFSICPENVTEKLLYKQSDEIFNMIKIKNPLSEDIACIRTSMANGLFNTISKNLKRKNSNFKLFEVGRVYLPKSMPLTELPNEVDMLSFASVCKEDNFFKFKGIVENMISGYDVTYEIRYSNLPYLHPGISADFVIKDSDIVIASIGLVHPKVVSNFEIANKTMYGQINLTELVKLEKKQFAVKHISKFQAVERDICVVCSEEISCKQIQDCVVKSCGNLLTDFSIFDIYREELATENKKSVAFKFVLQSNEKTLTDEDITKVYNKVLKDIEYKLGAKLK